MFRATILTRGEVSVRVMDSASQIEHSDRGQVVIAASNGGQESGRVGAATGCALLVLNDAGVGKENAGVSGLDILAAVGIPGATVSHATAAISDGRDMWANGVISHVNEPAHRAGLRAGDDLAGAVTAFVDVLIEERQRTPEVPT